MANNEQLLQWQDEVDKAFMTRVQKEVTQSCALPFALPLERIPEFIRQAAEWFWLNDDWSSESRNFAIPYDDICKNHGLNKLITLPSQVLGVIGCYKVQEGLKYGLAGDFSVERMMMSSYSMFGGVGSVGSGIGGTAGFTGYSLTDVISSMYEVSTFDQYLNPPLTYDYNIYSHKLVLLGDLGHSDLLLNCFIRCHVQDLYNNHYFFRYVVCLAKLALSDIYGMYEFKLPGGVTINSDKLESRASEEIEKIEEWVNNHNGVVGIIQPNTM